MSEENEKNEEQRPENVVNAYKDRLKVLRHAQEYSQSGEIPKAVEKYTHYLAILATYYKTEEARLTPKLFDQDKDLTEMLLISNVYWDLAKAYDRSPRLQKECVRCLSQFVTFSLGYKYQHVNAQMLKKFLRSKKAHNKKAFQQALDRLNVESKACYVATHAYPNNEYDILTILRKFKLDLLRFKLGKEFVTHYYCYSPLLIKHLSSNKFIDTIVNKVILKPLIFVFSFLLKIIYGHNKTTHN